MGKQNGFYEKKKVIVGAIQYSASAKGSFEALAAAPDEG